MVKKRYSAEQIIGKLREAEILFSQGNTVAAVTRQIQISDVTYYKLQKEYDGLSVDQAKRLKKLVADWLLDNAILKEAP